MKNLVRFHMKPCTIILHCEGLKILKHLPRGNLSNSINHISYEKISKISNENQHKNITM